MPKLTKSQRSALTKTELKVFAGERRGLRVIAAASGVTEFRRIALVERFNVEGPTSNISERAIAMMRPRQPFARPVADREAAFQEYDPRAV